MALAKPKTKLKFEETKVGEEVLDLVISYIHDVQDRNSLSLVSRKFFELDGITRKRLTVHVFYYPNPASLSKRFPFIESLTLKGLPSDFDFIDDYVINCTPWIQLLALEFRCLKELHIRHLVVYDKDLETLARIRGKDLRSLKIKKCEGYSSNGLMHVSKYCDQLRTLCLKYSSCYNYRRYVENGKWLHQLALNSTVLERLHVTDMHNLHAEDLTLLAKNCCNSLISLKVGVCHLSKLGEAFKYAVRLESFGVAYQYHDEESELFGFQFPPNIRSLSRLNLSSSQYSSVLPLLNQIRILKFSSVDIDDMDGDSMCLMFKRCPNLEVLYTNDVGGDRGLQVLGQFCKKLRKLANYSLVTHVGMIALAKGCTNLESLNVKLTDISNSNEVLECVGTHLKNLRKFRIVLGNDARDLPLDNGVRAMLMGSNKLENLDVSHCPYKGLTDVGLEYIGNYGANLRYLSLNLIGVSKAGLVKLSEGCQRLRKLESRKSPFNKASHARCVFNIPSLRYVSIKGCDRGRDSYTTVLATLTHPEFQL